MKTLTSSPTVYRNDRNCKRTSQPAAHREGRVRDLADGRCRRNNDLSVNSTSQNKHTLSLSLHETTEHSVLETKAGCLEKP